MERQWLGQNIDLRKLSEYAEDFFKNKGYVTGKDESKGEYVIKWAPRHVDSVSRSIYNAVELRISGVPRDFVIDMIASEATRKSIWLGMLTRGFGGGFITLQGSRLQETLDKLENEFWVYIEGKIAAMASQSLR